MMLTLVEEQTCRKEKRQFYLDVAHGLTQSPKRLPSKYFYDKIGDNLFQEIMASPDYYLTRCEMEIFSRQTGAILSSLLSEGPEFELIELGPGNCAKSIHLLRALSSKDIPFSYIPIDISENIINQLGLYLPTELPGLTFQGITGEYFNALQAHCTDSTGRKVIMCLGANIGNMTIAESHAFCQTLRQYLKPGDQCIIGFDIVKHPAAIRRAYDDREGLTREFNLNLLRRMNRELGTDFIIDKFDHYCSYDPLTGAAKSFLVCLQDMSVHLPGIVVEFEKNESIWTETSQKFTSGQIRKMAADNGFVHTTALLDSKGCFMDAIWTAV